MSENSESIFIAEPSPAVGRALSQFFGNCGFTVVLGDNLAALETMSDAQRASFELAILGGDAPSKEPETLREELAAALPSADIPLIVLDPRPAEPGAPRGLVGIGAGAYISRGASLLELLFCVRELLGSPEQNRRDEVRVWGGFKIHFKTEDDWKKALIYNISRGGAFIETSRIPDLGEHVTLRVRFPDSNRAIDVQGVVRWCNQPVVDGQFPVGFGIAFREFGEQTGEMLYKFVGNRRA